MSQELVLLQSVRTATGTATDIIRLYRERRVVDRANLARLRDQVALIERQAHAENVAALARTNIQELVKTQRLIDSMEPTGETFWLCIQQVRQLGDELAANLRAYSRG